MLGNLIGYRYFTGNRETSLEKMLPPNSHLAIIFYILFNKHYFAESEGGIKIKIKCE